MVRPFFLYQVSDLIRCSSNVYIEGILCIAKSIDTQVAAKQNCKHSLANILNYNIICF